MGGLGMEDGRRHSHPFPTQTTAGLASLADFFQDCIQSKSGFIIKRYAFLDDFLTVFNELKWGMFKVM